MAEISAAARQVLDFIAAGEAHDYHTIYGGHQFSQFSDHPRIAVKLGGGKYSTAAGRYQLLAPTWDAEKARLELPDFSPASQDQAAWDLAQRTYRRKTGRELESDASKGRVSWEALVKQWPSLQRAAPKQVGFQGGLNELSPAGRPSLTPLNQLFPGMDFSPVEHDPYDAARPLFSPVEHDPFQPEVAAK